MECTTVLASSLLTLIDAQLGQVNVDMLWLGESVGEILCGFEFHRVQRCQGTDELRA